MPKIVKEFSDHKTNQKRRKKNYDKIYSMILQAKKKLDNVRKNNNEDGSRRPSYAKISNRLPPRPSLGIYRNGSKGKDIKKESSESTFDRARLEADALKLFNGDTSESNYREEDLTHNETTNQSPNKSFVKNSLNWTQSTLEQSPILREKSRNQNTYFVKKKRKENLFKYYNSDKIEKQNNESKYVAQKENIFKRKLFQNDKEQSKDIIATQMQTFDNDFMKENRINENRTQQTLEDSKNPSNKSKLYVKLCSMTSVTNFEDSRSNEKGPLTTIITELQGIHSKSQQRVYKKYKQQLAAKYQAYNNLDTSLDSTSVIEYEVPNNSKNKGQNAEDGNIYLMQNDNVAHYGSTSLASQKAANFSFVNEEDSIQKDFNYIAHSSKDKRHNKDHFYLDLSKNVQCINNRKHAETSTHSNNSMLLAMTYSSDDYDSEEELTNIWKNASAEVTNKYNTENVEQPVIHQHDKRSHSVERSDKNLCDEAYMKRLYKKFEIDTNNKSPANERRTYVDSFSQQLLREKSKRELETVKSSDLSVKYQARTYSDASDALLISPNLMSTNKVNKISKHNKNLFEFPSRKDVSQREDTYLAHSSNFPTPSIINKQFVNTHDRVESFKPQIESIELEDSQDSLINQFDTNMYPNKLNRRNKWYKLHNLEASSNTNSFMERLNQERAIPVKKRHHHHINYLDSSNSYNFNAQSIQSLPQQTRLYTCENDDRRQELFKKTIRNPYPHIVFNNSRAINHPSSTLNLSQTGPRRRESTYEEIFTKPDMECSRNQTNSYHCDNQYIHLDSANCQNKCHVSQARYLHEGALQSGILQVEDHNSNINNYINLSNNVQRIPSLQQQHTTYLNVHDDQHRVAQNVIQPVKYFAVSNNSNIQRIPIYISDRSIENAPIVPLVKSNVQNTEECYFHKCNNLQHR